MPTLWGVNTAWAIWRRWWDSPVRDIAMAVLLTAVTVIGAYGEAHPGPQLVVIAYESGLVTPGQRAQPPSGLPHLPARSGWRREGQAEATG